MTAFVAGSTTDTVPESMFGDKRVGGLRGGLAELREAIEAQLNSA